MNGLIGKTWILSETSNLRREIPITLNVCKVKFCENLYILSRNGQEIFICDKNGSLLRIVKLDIPGKVITQADKNIVLNRKGDPESVKLRKKAGFPKRKPLIWDIVVDDTGNLWLKKGDSFGFRSSEVTGYSYMIIDENGEYFADQSLPIDLKIVKKKHAYGFVTTEDDLRIFKRYKLKQK